MIPQPFNKASTRQPSRIRLSLFWRITLSMTLLVFLGTGMLWVYLHMNLTQLLNRQADTFGNSIARQMAESAAELVLAEDKMALSSMLDNMVAQSPHILRVVVLDETNTLISQSEKSIQQTALQLESYESPIQFQDVTAGTLKLQVDKSPITNSLIRTIKVMSVLAIVTLLILVGSGVFFARQLTNPIRRLQGVAEEVAQGNLSPKLPRPKNDEVGDLVRSFDQMLQGLRDKESIENTFSSYLSKDVARDILSNLNQTRMPLKPVKGSVLFIDIVGFTSLCEHTSANEVGSILNQYYFLVHQAAKMYRGSVDKYIGDGAMVTFGVNKDDKKHAMNGVCTAQIFLRLTQFMNVKRQREGKAPLQFRLGLHSGEMLAGTIGSNERMEFTAVGDTVNTAARLCSHGEPDRLLISQQIFDANSTKGLLVTESAQSIQVKGKTQPMKTYSVLHLAPKFNRLLMQQQNEVEAMQVYG